MVSLKLVWVVTVFAGILSAQGTTCPQIVNFNAQCSNQNPPCTRNVVLRQCSGPNGGLCCNPDGGGQILCCGQQLSIAATGDGACPDTCSHGLIVRRSAGPVSTIEIATDEACPLSTKFKTFVTYSKR
jgi:hypothetical protein